MTAHEDRTLRIVATLCGGSGCPTVYRTDRGTLVIQGSPVSAEAAGIDLPDGETLVEIPEQLLTELAQERKPAHHRKPVQDRKPAQDRKAAQGQTPAR